jgi:hypothetical protein
MTKIRTNELLARLSEDPTFNYERGYSEAARRLRAAGLIEGPVGHIVITADGVSTCRRAGVKTPEDWAAERDVARKRAAAIAILSRKQEAKK